MTATLPTDPLVDGRYRLEKLVGEGTYGAVWLARDTRLEGRAVALKFMKAELLVIPEAVARFDAEAAALALLQHPNVVNLLDRGEWQGQRFLVTEYIDGTTLAWWIDSQLMGTNFPRSDWCSICSIRCARASKQRTTFVRQARSCTVISSPTT